MNPDYNYAAIAGGAIVAMALAAGFSFGYVWTTLVDFSAPVQTIANLKSALPIFRAGIAGWLFIALCDVVAAWALYLLFKSTHPGPALLAALLRLAYTGFLEMAIGDLLSATAFLDSGASLSPDLLNQQVFLQLESFENTWSIGLILFGLHLAALGLLVRQTKAEHWIWGILLLIAGCSYTFIHLQNLLGIAPDVPWGTIENILAVPMTIGELGFALWLLIERPQFILK
jgi:hypothetical protein